MQPIHINMFLSYVNLHNLSTCDISMPLCGIIMLTCKLYQISYAIWCFRQVHFRQLTRTASNTFFQSIVTIINHIDRTVTCITYQEPHIHSFDHNQRFANPEITYLSGNIFSLPSACIVLLTPSIGLLKPLVYHFIHTCIWKMTSW